MTSSATASALPPVALDLGRQALQPVEPPRRQRHLGAGPASTCAKCWPRPDEAPVTSAVLPFRENGFSRIF